MIQTGSIKLAGIDLNNSLQWVNRFTWQPVADNVRRTLGGGQVIYTQSLLEGRPITLSATIDTGWLTKDMVDQITALTASPTTSRTLEFHGEFYTVRFSFADQAPVSFQPLRAKQDIAANDYMIGTINLYTV